MLVPLAPPGDGDERLADLESRGLVRRGTGTLPDGFLDDALPDGSGWSLSEAVAQERGEGW